MSNALGGTLKRCLKHREKSDDEEKPHASAIEVSDGARERAIRPSALLEAKALHELGWRRPDEGLKHAVEVEWREPGGSG